jgi:hypothetical protein
MRRFGNSMTTNAYEHQVITRTISGATDLLSGEMIGTLQANYPMTEADFLRLKNGRVATRDWASGIFLLVIGFAFNIVPKLLPVFAGRPPEVTPSEWITIGIGLLISLALWAVGLTMPNERKKVMRTIETHFEAAPKTQTIIRAQHDN